MHVQNVRKYPKTLYTLRLRTFSSNRNTTRKKSVKVTLNMGIPLYSKDKYKNPHVNILSLGREAHKKNRGIEVKDYFNFLRFSILLNSQDGIVRKSVSLKRKQEQIHFKSLAHRTNYNDLREIQAQISWWRWCKPLHRQKLQRYRLFATQAHRHILPTEIKRFLSCPGNVKLEMLYKIVSIDKIARKT